MNKNRDSLPNIIKKDFLFYKKMHLFLLIAILISANSIIFVVYQTRLLVIQKEELTIKQKQECVIWNNLIIKKNKLIQH